MLPWQSQSAISYYKTSLAVFLVITLAAIYVVRPSVLPSGEWMRKVLTSAHVATMVDVVTNRSTAIFDLVLGSYRSSRNGSAPVAGLIAASPEEPTVNKTGRYVSSVSYTHLTLPTNREV